jgi:hypothetical protein
MTIVLISNVIKLLLLMSCKIPAHACVLDGLIVPHLSGLDPRTVLNHLDTVEGLLGIGSRVSISALDDDD